MSESIDYDSDEEEEVQETKNKKYKSKKSDFVHAGSKIITSINYKVSFLLFIISVIIFSDVFIENIINNFSDTVDGECTTTKGTMIQLLFMVLAYIIIDLIVKFEII